MRVRHKTRKRARELRQNLTDAEAILWSKLQDKQLCGHRFQRQHPIGPYIADFACRKYKLVIEVDGETHWTPEQKAHDARRAGYISAQGWTLVRFWNSEIYENLYGVLECILQRLPPPSR